MTDDPRKASSYRPHPVLGDCRELATPGEGPCWGAVQDRRPPTLDIFKRNGVQPPMPLCVGHRNVCYGQPRIEEYV